MSDVNIPISFEIEDIDYSELNKTIAEQHRAITDRIERLCEKAKAKGSNVCLAVRPMRQNPATMAYEFPYAFIEVGAPVDRECRVYGPWSSVPPPGSSGS